MLNLADQQRGQFVADRSLGRLMTMRGKLRKLARNQRGAVVVETAIVVPILAILAFGGYDVSRIIARQLELQNGAADAEQIVLAATAGTAATDAPTIRTVLSNTLGIPVANIDVDLLYRCNNSTSLQSSQCTTGNWQASYVRVTFRDSYTPMWTRYGVGNTINYNMVRQVQIKQEQK